MSGLIVASPALQARVAVGRHRSAPVVCSVFNSCKCKYYQRRLRFFLKTIQNQDKLHRPLERPACSCFLWATLWITMLTSLESHDWPDFTAGAWKLTNQPCRPYRQNLIEMACRTHGLSAAGQHFRGNGALQSGSVAKAVLSDRLTRCLRPPGRQSSPPCPLQPTLTSMRRGRASSAFGIRRVSTPLSSLASILPGSSSRLSVKLRR